MPDQALDFAIYRMLLSNIQSKAYPTTNWVDFTQPPFEIVMDYTGDIVFDGNPEKRGRGITKWTIASFLSWEEALNHNPYTAGIIGRLWELRERVERAKVGV